MFRKAVSVGDSLFSVDAVRPLSENFLYYPFEVDDFSAGKSHMIIRAGVLSLLLLWCLYLLIVNQHLMLLLLILLSRSLGSDDHGSIRVPESNLLTRGIAKYLPYTCFLILLLVGGHLIELDIHELLLLLT